MSEPSEVHPVERRKVFVSHAHVDNDLCDVYVQAIRDRGFDVWYDQTNLQAGKQLSIEIEHYLDISKAFIVMLSQASILSPWVRLETDTYQELELDDLDRILIPVRIEACEVPSLLRSRLWVDAIGKPFDKVIDEIVDALNAPARTRGLASEMASKRGVSRLTMLRALAATASLSIVAGSAFTFLASRSGLFPGLTSTRIEFAPTATPLPSPTPDVGDAIYTFTGHTDHVTAVAWSPGGSRIASAGNDGTVKIWSPSQINTLTCQGHTGPVNSLTWSPDGSHFASASNDHTVRIWDAATGALAGTFTGHAGQVNSVAWSPDGKHILSTGDDKTYRTWSPTSLRIVHTAYPGGMACRSGAWSPNGKYVIIAVYYGAYSFPTSTGYVLDWVTGSMLSQQNSSGQGYKTVTWSPDAKLVAAAGYAQTVDIWPSAAGTGPITTGRSFSGHFGTVNSVMWSPDNKRVASCASDQTVQVWDPVTMQVGVISRQHSAAVNSIAWSPDSSLIASASDDRTVKIIRTK